MPSAKSSESKSNNNLLFYSGLFLTAGSFVILFLSFKDVVKNEVTYSLKRPDERSYIKPVDVEFGITVPKIGANSRIVANVDPYDAKAYQAALAKGVAHAKGTVYPGQVGNTFLFSHSSVDFFSASQFNSVFYLLNKLERGDHVYIFYKRIMYTYEVTESKIIEAGEVKYLSGRDPNGGSTLSLMTCWPAGTTLKRLLVQAQLVGSEPVRP